MSINTQKYVRKPFYVEAVEVTAENIKEVAEWAMGDVRTDAVKSKNTDQVEYIQVRVHRPLNERQTKAYVGDWILYAGTGFKVYTAKAFAGCFEPATGETGDAAAQATKPQPPPVSFYSSGGEGGGGSGSA